MAEKKQEKTENAKLIARVIVKKQWRDYESGNQEGAREWVKKLMDAGITFIEVEKVYKDD